MMAMNDSTLIEQSICEPKAFGEIFDRHFDAIAGFCVRRIGAVRGEDVAGDVFRWAFENRGRFDLERDDARPWLFGIANNLIREALRSAGRQQLAYDRWLSREMRVGSELAFQVAAAVDAQHDLSALAAVLELQPVEEVETLLLFAWEQLTYSQIAEALAIPVGTVRSRIHRLRQHLHEVLDTRTISEDLQSNQGGSLCPRT
jgi:RNA polymerase sigma-70 factor (ECF subfamily)